MPLMAIGLDGLSDSLLPIGQIARWEPGLGLPVENFYLGFC